jgi:hypothetical protein
MHPIQSLCSAMYRGNHIENKGFYPSFTIPIHSIHNIIKLTNTRVREDSKTICIGCIGMTFFTLFPFVCGVFPLCSAVYRARIGCIGMFCGLQQPRQAV